MRTNLATVQNLVHHLLGMEGTIGHDAETRRVMKSVHFHPIRVHVEFSVRE
jgi:hypothetical protein